MAKKNSFGGIIREYLGKGIKLERYQKAGVFLLVVVLSGFCGWLLELLVSPVGRGRFYMVGGNILPWMNIYAIGALLIVPITYKFRKYPWLVFVLAAVVSFIVELIAGWLVYTIGNGMRYWDYNGQPWNVGNIGGFVCFASAAVFATLSMFFIYAVVPFCIMLSVRMNRKAFLTLATVLFTLVMVDEVTNLTLKNLNLPTAIDFYKMLGLKYYGLITGVAGGL